MLPLVLDDVLVNFDSGRVRCAAEVLCDFARHGHQVIMFTCHEHITDIFEDAQADVRVLPPRDGSEPVRRRRKPVVELEPPPPPPVVPEPALPPRITAQPAARITVPEIDPNPLLQMAAHEEPLFDPVHPLPEKPRREKKRKLKPKLPDYWPLAEIPLPKPAPQVTSKLPEQWPLAEAPAAPPRAAVLPAPETFEVLAFRCQPESWPLPEILPSPSPRPNPSPQPAAKIVISPPEPTPPPPKFLPPRPNAERHRFTWESPEMYWEEERD
jgi:hypothetical protein